MCVARGTWEVCLGLLLRERVKRARGPPSSPPTSSVSCSQEEETQHKWAEYSTGAVRKSVQATFFRVLGQTGTFSMEVPQSQPGNLSRGPSLSKTFIVVSRSVGLQDALWILLHQRAPSHFPCQKQILAIHGVKVLHLQTESKGREDRAHVMGAKAQHPQREERDGGGNSGNLEK